MIHCIQQIKKFQTNAHFKKLSNYFQAMVKGAQLTVKEKELMYNCLVVHRKSEFECFQLIFESDSKRISVDYIKRKKSWFLDPKTSANEKATYIYGSPHVKKTKCLIGEAEMAVLKPISTFQPKRSFTAMATQLSSQIGAGFPIVSPRTIQRSLKKARMSEKTVTHVPANLDADLRASTLLSVAHNRIDQLHNFDESSAAGKKFEAKRALSEIGEPAECYDWSLTDDNGKTYSVIADYTPRGWTIWRIFMNNINHVSVETFLRDDLSHVLSDGDVVLHDGASVHLVESTMILLDEITEGRHVQVAPYSHDLSPVEKGFANIWKYVRGNWNKTNQSATEILNAAFQLYSVGGIFGDSAQGHWNLYNRNHQKFLEL